MLEIALGAAAIVVYLLVTLAFYLQSRELDKHIDYNKMKRWNDDAE